MRITLLASTFSHAMSIPSSGKHLLNTNEGFQLENNRKGQQGIVFKTRSWNFVTPKGEKMFWGPKHQKRAKRKKQRKGKRGNRRRKGKERRIGGATARREPSAWEFGVERVRQIVVLQFTVLNVLLFPTTITARHIQFARGCIRSNWLLQRKINKH